ncbi:ribonuclease P protein component [Aureitalea marina]|uniref:Ribonuclease P protein component n=1 Tax=Aureitalea marina TaxID=930804 RepID=A0A2S7KS60_9FLAO|nr:ribonuclease P protein component [Aureitalea marina]PQB05450.1 ribonuclease P protein component [Aureitalea marina]
MSQRFKRSERLKSRKLIDQLFDRGLSLRQGSIKLIYVPMEAEENQAGFSVPKKLMAKAVDRNAIKRKMREAYRLHKHMLSPDGGPQYAMMFLYLSSKKPTYEEVQRAMVGLLDKLKGRSEKQ